MKVAETRLSSMCKQLMTKEKEVGKASMKLGHQHIYLIICRQSIFKSHTGSFELYIL